MSDGINDMFRTSRTAGSGLRAARLWMTAISNNVANKESLDTGKFDKVGNFIPYARQVPVFAKVLSEDFRDNKAKEDVRNGVTVKRVVELDKEFERVYDPNHPAARKAGTPDAGYVYYPKINLATEMADAKIAGAYYEANITTMAITSKMFDQALTIGKGN